MKDKILSSIKEQINNHSSTDWKEGGRVISFAEGIATVSCMYNAFMGEQVTFQSGHIGIIISLNEFNVQIIVFRCNVSSEPIKEGDTVQRTKKKLNINVGDFVKGRIVDALGLPIDGEAFPQGVEREVFVNASSLMNRRAISEPCYTGTKYIDSMIPIGKGQRELIIGDRQTGKTTIAIDMILNQKSVHCIYVAIGQKRSDIARIVKTLKEKNAMKHTTIVASAASDKAPDKYIAPYTGCAIAEYFMNKGEDALIIYDDLSKHAIAYREISLLLRRSPGREAYPGDIFYVHSSLLERAANIEHGSITAIPIIETQAGDISSYIATNVISITDGQIFLDSSLFNQGTRPAIDVGMSVSRVGGSAQIPLVKKLCSKMRLYLAKSKELENFAKMSSDIDKETAQIISNGSKVNRLMIQDPNKPVSIQESIVVYYIIAKFIDRLNNVEKELEMILEKIRKHDIWNRIEHAKIEDLHELDGEIEQCLQS